MKISWNDKNFSIDRAGGGRTFTPPPKAQDLGWSEIFDRIYMIFRIFIA